MAEEKKPVSVFDYAKKLNKEFESETFLRKSDVIPGYRRLKSRALGMSYPLFGGLAYGRIVVFSGKQHSGKTSAAWEAIGDYQKENPDRVCVFVDAEQSADIEFQALMNDVDLSKLVIMQPEEGMSGEQVLESILELQLNTDDIGLIVVDSVPALVTAQNLKNEFTKDTGKQGTIAKSLHKFCGEILPSLHKKENILIFINQVRVKDVMYNGAPIYSEPGGDALKFYSSISVRFGTRSFMKGETEISGENNGDGADGFRIKFQITKNKTAPCNRGGGFITYRYDTGMDWMFDLLEIATTFDFIKRLNNITYALINLETGEMLKDENGEELKGKKKELIEYINTHDKFRETYVQMLTDYISSKNTKKDSAEHLLSAEEEAEIRTEEGLVAKDE